MAVNIDACEVEVIISSLFGCNLVKVKLVTITS